MSLKRRWNRACAETIGHDLFWRIAVDHLSIERQLQPLIEQHVRGIVLDAGAGRLAWRKLLRARASLYLATDYAPAHPEIDFCADLQGRLPLAPDSVDTIFCCSVMEHAPEPWRILPEMQRVLRPGGRVILSVPFLYFLHGAPADYFRFTRFGIVALAERAGFQVLDQRIGGGLAHTLGQAASVLVAGALWTPRAPWLVTAPARALFVLARLIDRLDRGGVFAQTVNLVLAKPAGR